MVIGGAGVPANVAGGDGWCGGPSRSRRPRAAPSSRPSTTTRIQESSSTLVPFIVLKLSIRTRLLYGSFDKIG